MKMCSICNKNIATIFTAKVINGKSEMVGICIKCAQKMGIPVIDQLMQQAGITPEELENLNEQMTSMLQENEGEETEDNGIMSLFKGGFDPINEGDNIPKEKEAAASIKEQPEEKTKNGKRKKKRKFLDMYGISLTDKAKENRVDWVIGRNREIDRVIQILNRRTKNNPVLLENLELGKLQSQRAWL
jgi:ATP-dependent Clp protease ATP-binding subunit ClpA